MTFSFSKKKKKKRSESLGVVRGSLLKRSRPSRVCQILSRSLFSSSASSSSSSSSSSVSSTLSSACSRMSLQEQQQQQQQQGDRVSACPSPHHERERAGSLGNVESFCFGN